MLFLKKKIKIKKCMDNVVNLSYFSPVNVHLEILLSRFHCLKPCESQLEWGHFYNYTKSLLLAQRIQYESDDRMDGVDCFYHLNIKNTHYMYVSVQVIFESSESYNF